MSIISEFKKFAVRGNVIDLAVGIIVGGAFNKVVSSLVEDVIMPPIGNLLGKVDFSNLYFNLGGGDYPSLAAAKEAGAATINYGAFLNSMITFTITAFAVFLLVRFINRLKDKEEGKQADVSPAAKECPFCLTQVNMKASRCPACTSELLAR